MQKTAMTADGEAALRKELEHLIKVVRPGIVEAIATAREHGDLKDCLLYTSPSPRDRTRSRMPSSA